MQVFREIRALNREQRNAVVASFLGWTLDAFDFFLVVFVLATIASEFQTTVEEVAFAITVTLAMRPVGAFIFGWLADRYGRRPVLMVDILLFSLLELASAFAPNLPVFLVLRTLFGIAMGGEWGIGSALAMETIPPTSREVISGFLQEGYAVGYLLAGVAYWIAFPIVGWRGLFVLGVAPALLVVYIRMNVRESPVWAVRRPTPGSMWVSIRQNWRLFVYVIVLMACFNAFSHGTQDLYPTFLRIQHRFEPAIISLLTIIGNLGAIAGGIVFGAYSESIGRRRAIMLAALLSLPILYLWAYSDTLPMLSAGAFLMQFMVQGAWGVIPVHLNELSPDDVRGTFPGFTYQLGNLLISLLAPYQARLAASHGNDYAFALATTAGAAAVLITVVVGLGRERKGIRFGQTA